MEKVGLVLSGGAARGIAHIGVLQALDELGIRPDVISAVSSGALVGALYAAGHSPESILGYVKEHASTNLFRMMLLPGGLFSASGIRNIIKTLIPQDDFEHLSIPLVVTATDLNTNEAVTFSTGSLNEIVAASCAIPGIFSHVDYNGHCLVDGGIMDNLPVACIRDRCEKIIAIHVNKLYACDCRSLTRMALIDKCLHLAVWGNVAANVALCDIFIEPELHHQGMFDLKDAELMFETGYRAIMAEKGVLSLKS